MSENAHPEVGQRILPGNDFSDEHLPIGCYWCGRKAARGASFAYLSAVQDGATVWVVRRYCHGDDQEISCYEYGHSAGMELPEGGSEFIPLGSRRFTSNSRSYPDGAAGGVAPDSLPDPEPGEVLPE